MHQVAKREGRPDAFVSHAAISQASGRSPHWTNAPSTKGQRISQFVTVTGLADFSPITPAAARPALQKN